MANRFQQAMSIHADHMIFLFDRRRNYGNQIHELGMDKYTYLLNAIDHECYVLSLIENPAEYLKKLREISDETETVISKIMDGATFTEALLEMDAGKEHFIHPVLIPEEMKEYYIIHTPREIAELEGKEALEKQLGFWDSDFIESAYAIMGDDSDDPDAILPVAGMKEIMEENQICDDESDQYDTLEMISCINTIRALNYLDSQDE